MMICVSIGRGRQADVMAEHRRLASQGIKLVEIRLDCLDGEVNLRQLMAQRPSPVIVACRRTADGGRFTGSEPERLALLRTAIEEGADYVEIEHDAAASVPRSGRTKRIVSFYDLHKTFGDLDGIHRRLGGLGPDIIKLCTMARQPHDNLRILELIQQSRTPTVGLCLGEIGTPSQILAARFGAPLVYAASDEGEAVGTPGQLAYRQLADIYRADRINAETDVYGIIADPVSHSMGPFIHNAGFHHYGLNKVYVPFLVPREHLAQFMQDAPALGVKALSVTMPHKEEVIQTLTQVDDAVRGIGATNTILFDGKKTTGHNTDYQGAMDSLEAAIGGPDGMARRVRGKTALVLGSGGVGKAITCGLLRRGVSVVATDGVPEQTARLSQRFHCPGVPWSERYSVPADLLFNCTPVGMHPDADATPFEKDHLRPSMIVFDAVYNPERTMFLRDAEACGCTVVRGVDMFVRQACLQFSMFTGREAPAELMRETIRRVIAERNAAPHHAADKLA